MNINKFTQKSLAAVQGCEKLAYEYGNQQIEQEHLLASLLELEDSLILKLMNKDGDSAGTDSGRSEKSSGKASESQRRRPAVCQQ